MDIIFHRPQRAAHFIIAISIALSVGACVAPQPEPGASNAANQALQAKPDPVQVVSDALGERLHLMVSASNPGAASLDHSSIAPASRSE
jgi:hypothetical protein